MRAAEGLEALVEAAAEGNDAALADLVRATQPAVWRRCTALGSVDEEEDLVQETYLRALPAFRRDCDVHVWFLSIARRVCADHVRRRQRQRRLFDRLARPESAAPEADGTTDLLRHLSEDRRKAFVLTQVVGLSYEEAAAVAGCPVGTIRSRVSRARSDLLDSVRSAESG